ncbi:MAG: hypothetical protein H0W72_15765, partial [Planctomycetes bacterium]|nr:hypothetical protein [Planctomycetota bacterium]
ALLGFATLAVLLLSGCHPHHWSGSVTIAFSSDDYPTAGSGLVISGEVGEHGDADVDAVAWSVASAPSGAVVTIDDPYATDTWAYFSDPGVYVLRYEVWYWVGSDLYRDEAFYRLDVDPPAFG